MAWSFNSSPRASREVFLSIKENVAIDFGPLEDFKPDRRGENVLNVKCKHGGKAVKISAEFRSGQICCTLWRLQNSSRFQVEALNICKKRAIKIKPNTITNRSESAYISSLD